MSSPIASSKADDCASKEMKATGSVDEEEDEFEQLFNFGTSSENPNDESEKKMENPINDDDDDDIFEVGSPSKPKSSLDDDNDDDIFNIGTPKDELTPIERPKEDIVNTVNTSAEDKTLDDDLFFPVTVAPPTENNDDEAFYRHDEGTRDFLEWLDKDKKPETSTEPTRENTVDLEKDILATTPEKKEPLISEELIHKDKEQTDENDEDEFEKVMAVVEVLDDDNDNDEKDGADVAIEDKNSEAEQMEFETLSQAIQSSNGTMEQIRKQFAVDKVISDEDRKYLWCKAMTSGKNYFDIKDGSCADSYLNWTKELNTEEDQPHHDDIDKLTSNLANIYDASSSQQGTFPKDDLKKLLMYRRRAQQPKSSPKKEKNTIQDSNNESIEMLAPVAALLLHVGIESQVASVILSSIQTTLPLLSLPSIEEQAQACEPLETQLYLLLCYHNPTLVIHLDRHISGWQHSLIPQTFFVTNYVSATTSMDLESSKKMIERSIHLWDTFFLNGDANDMKFFLACSLFHHHSDTLLMLRGEELSKELKHIMTFMEVSDESKNMSDATFVEHNTESQDNLLGNTQNTESDNNEDSASFMHEWRHRAISLKEVTPISVVSNLCLAEDEAINQSLIIKNKRAEEKLKQKLEEEAKNHRLAMEKKRTQNMHKERLRNFYKKNNPEKTDDEIEHIWNVYKDRLELLDSRLREKYNNQGFMPTNSVLNSKLSAQTNKLLQSMGHGIQIRRKEIMAYRADRRVKKLEEGLLSSLHTSAYGLVSLKVNSDEVLPVSCGVQTLTSHPNSLKYFLVDSRPDDTADEQGRFPTAMRLSPEALMDPDLYHQQIEKFESLRGAVHICIIGVGFSAFQKLYNHHLSKEEEKLLQDDESRANMCALFFIKKGFPFVSILDGGFAAAHAWLAREGTKHSIPITSALVNYDDENSLFAELEEAHREQEDFANSTKGEKTTKVIQKLLDNSMARLTISEAKIEALTNELKTQEGREKVKESVSKIVRESRLKESVTNFISRKQNKSGTSDHSEKDSDKLTSISEQNTYDGQPNSDIHDNVSPTSSMRSTSFEEEKDEGSESNNNETDEKPKMFRMNFGAFKKKNNELDKEVVKSSQDNQSDTGKNVSESNVAKESETIGQQTKSSLFKNPFSGLKVASTNTLSGTETDSFDTKESAKLEDDGSVIKSNPLFGSTFKEKILFNRKLGEAATLTETENNDVSTSEDSVSENKSEEKSSGISIPSVSLGMVLASNPFSKKKSADDDIEKEIEATLKQFEKDKGNTSIQKETAPQKVTFASRFSALKTNKTKEEKSKDSLFSSSVKKLSFKKFSSLSNKNKDNTIVEEEEEEDVLFMDINEENKDEIAVESTFSDKSKSKSDIIEEKTNIQPGNNLDEHGDTPSVSNNETVTTSDPISEIKSTDMKEESVIEFV